MSSCHFCQSSNLLSIIPLGKLPLANALCKTSTERSPTYNLEVMLCKQCNLAQLKDLIDPKELFSHYFYLSSNSDTMLESAKNLTSKLIPHLSKDAFIIEIASNDGYLLKNYVAAHFDVLGIDPAKNIADIANAQGITTLCEFFNAPLAQKLSSKKADLIHANNVLAHIPDLHSFIKGLKILLKKKGVIVIEVPYFKDLIEKLEFDTIYHEHVYYFSLSPLIKIFKQYHLDIYNLEKINIHGGSLRLFICHQGEENIDPKIAGMLKNEEFLYHESTYQDFMNKLYSLKRDLTTLLKDLKKNNKKIAAYGASAKGTTLLNFFDIGDDLISFVVDKSPLKQNYYTPGKNLPIYEPYKLIEIDYALLLSWNFKEEIINQQKQFQEKGGHFIIPLPIVEVC